MVVSEESPLSWIAAHPLVGIAAIASASAGLVHAAAAGTHSVDRTAGLVFAVTSVLQLAWAFVYVARPSRLPAILGMILNGMFAVSWALSRSVGLPFPEALSGVEHASMQDGVAAGLGVVAATCAAVAAWRPRFVSRAKGSVAVVAATGFVLLAIAVPGIWATHGHGDMTTPGPGAPQPGPGGATTPDPAQGHDGHGG